MNFYWLGHNMPSIFKVLFFYYLSFSILQQKACFQWYEKVLVKVITENLAFQGGMKKLNK